MLGVDLDGSRRIWPDQVGCLVGPDGSWRIVWMIIGMIKAHPTNNRMARQAAGRYGRGALIGGHTARQRRVPSSLPA
jgi:hypothetical protein